MTDAAADRFFGKFRAIAALDLPRTAMSSPFEGVLGGCYGTVVEAGSDDLRTPLAQLGEAPSDILDLCCGGGRLLAAAAAAGHAVSGVDISADMLAIARRRLGGLAAELITADALTIDMGRTFDTVVIAGLSLTLFPDPAMRAALLRNAARHLRPGGRLLLDYSPLLPDAQYSTGDVLLPMTAGQRRGFYLVGWERVPSTATQRTNMYCELAAPDGRTERFLGALSFTLFTPGQLEDELRASGITPIGSIDPYTVPPGSPPSNRWVAGTVGADVRGAVLPAGGSLVGG